MWWLFYIIVLPFGQCVEDEDYDLTLLSLIPTIDFSSGGQYYGQHVVDNLTGRKVPQGIGSFISKDGNVLYAGRWENGNYIC